MFKKRFLIAVTSIVVFVAAQQLATLSSASREFRSASLFVKFNNDSSQSLAPLIYFNIRGRNSFNFSNTTISVLDDTNTTVSPIEDGSGVQLYSKCLRPLTSIEFQVDDIELVQTESYTLLDTQIIADYNFVNTSDVSYNAVLAMYGRIGIYDLSIASVCTFTDKINGAVIYRTEYRAEVLNYLAVFYMVVLGVGLLTLISVLAPRLTSRLPFVTMTIIGATIFLYVFIGSGFEINSFSSLKNFRLLFPLAFLIHGYDLHIKGNLLPYFILLSFLFESWLAIRTRLASFFWWYLVPLFAYSVTWGTLTFITSGRFDFGLSLPIEIMTWSLWAYIIKNHQSILKRSHDILFSILAGIPSFVFLGWLFNLVYYPAQTAYYQGLTIVHTVPGFIAMIIVFGVVFGKEIIGWFKAIHIHM